MTNSIQRKSSGLKIVRKNNCVWRISIVAVVCALFLASRCFGGGLLTPVQNGSVLSMTNGNVRLEYDLNTGRANFLWQNSLKVAGFNAGVGLYSEDVLTNYVTSTAYTSHSWTVTSNVVQVTSTRSDLPVMKQIFILDQNDTFLTRLEISGSGLQSRWMSPLIVDTAGGVDLGSYNDNR